MPISPFLQAESGSGSGLAERIERRRQGVVRPPVAGPTAPDISAIPSLTGLAQQYTSPFAQVTQAGENATFFEEQKKQAELLKQAAAQQKLQTSPFTGPIYTPDQKLSQARQAIIQSAQKYIGTPYSWGGGNTSGPTLGQGTGKYPKQATSTVGFDCSGLVQYAYARAGIQMPRVSYGQLKKGTRTSINNLSPGDLVGFGNGHHIAIYLGNGKIIEAQQTGTPVHIRTLTPGDYKKAFGVHLVM